MFGRFTGRARRAALAELRDLLREVGPAEVALKELRAAHGLTQAELAARAGLTQGQVSAAETGARPLTPDTAASLAGALGVDPRALEAAIKLGRLRRSLEDGGSSEELLTTQILSLMAITNEFVGDPTLQADLMELLTESLGAAVERDRGRLKELAREKAQDGKAPTKVATKSRKKGPDRDRHGRRISKPTTSQGSPGEAATNVALKGRRPSRDALGRKRGEGGGVTRDALGRNVANRRPG